MWRILGKVLNERSQNAYFQSEPETIKKFIYYTSTVTVVDGLVTVIDGPITVLKIFIVLGSVDDDITMVLV